MQGVHHPSEVDRAGGGDEGLAGHLPAEHALAVLVGRDATEDVDLDGLEVEQGHEVVECTHPAILASHPSRAPRGRRG